MTNTSHPKEPITQQEGSVSIQSTPGEDKNKQEPGGVGGMEVARGPHDNSETASNPKDPYEHLKTIIMGLTLLVTICILIATVFSSCAAKRSADANVAATRAWITMEGWENLSLENGLRFAGTLVLKNAGRTPATQVDTTAETLFFPEPYPKEPQFSRCPARRIGNMGIATEGRDWRNRITGDELTREQIGRLKNQTARIVIHVCTTYRDIIIPQEERVTEGAFFWPAAGREDVVAIYSRYFRMK